MDDGARGWLLKTATKHYWRVSRWYDLDDLVQEGYACYYETLMRYEKDSKRLLTGHKMALFKMVFMSRITDLANKRTKSVKDVCLSDLFSDDSPTLSAQRVESFLESVVAEQDISSVSDLLTRAPKCVRDALALFGTEAGLLKLRSAHRHVHPGGRLRRETFNEKLCRLTGYDPAVTDIVGTLRDALVGEGRERPLKTHRPGPVVVERRVRGRRYVRVSRSPSAVVSCG